MNYMPDEESPIKEDLEPLIVILKNDPDWNKRFGAASKLYRIGKEKAVDPLISTLQKDPNKEMRRFAADLLGRLGDPRATWALIYALREGLIDNDPTIANHARDALLKIHSADLESILVKTISDKQEEMVVRLKAVEMLGKLGDSESIKELIILIKNPNTDGKLRARAIEELIYTGNLAGLQLILDYLNDISQKDFQKVVVRALGKTPFKNKTIVFRVGETLVRLSEIEEGKKDKKDTDLIYFLAEALKNLARNINYSLPDFMTELLTLRQKKKE